MTKEKIYNGYKDNHENRRPAAGIACRVVDAKGKKSADVYELVNIRMNGGRFDTYLVKNDRTGKRRAVRQIMPEKNDARTIAIREKARAAAFEKAAAAFNAMDNAARLEYIVSEMSGKLDGIAGVGSSAIDNKICAARRTVPGTVCEKCYAAALLAMRDGLANKTILAKRFLSGSGLLPVELYPVLNRPIRIEPFGDVDNVNQAAGYLGYPLRNPGQRCAAWSKNLEIWKAAFDEYGKPANLQFVYSVPELNNTRGVTLESVRAAGYWFVDRIFVVWSDIAAAMAAGVEINCGGRSCFGCGLQCYTAGGPEVINELEKNAARGLERAIEKAREDFRAEKAGLIEAARKAGLKA